MKVLNNLSDPSLVKIINSGKIGIIPTDTVYGMVGIASNPDVANKIYSLKRPGIAKKGTLIAANLDQLEQLGSLKEDLLNAEEYLGRGVSVIVRLKKNLNYLNFDTGCQAVRIIKNGPLNNLLTKVGPLITTSANYGGQSTVENIGDAIKEFGDKLDFYVDGGHKNGIPSTIIELKGSKITVIRQGSLKI
jgi:L-threonylcarbamoyladenylate synthase